MYFPTSVFFAALLATGAVAEVCTVSKAVSFEALIAATKSKPAGSSSGSSSALDDFTANNDNLDTLSNSANSATYGAIGSITSGYTKKLRVRATLNCVGTENCLSLKTGALFCLDFKTAEFHDAEGSSGNLLTGDYTLADGRKWNMNKGPMPTASGSVGLASATASVKSSATVSGTAATALASPTATSGAEKLEMGAGVAVVALGMLFL